MFPTRLTFAFKVESYWEATLKTVFEDKYPICLEMFAKVLFFKQN